MRCWSLALSFTLVGCSVGSAGAEESTRLDTGEAAGADLALLASPDPSGEEPPLRVLVTGFNDWRELGEPPNIWRCRENPSCRLLLGEPTTTEPSEYGGPLAQRLRSGAPDIEWRFATMPVTWEVFDDVPADVDVIVNIGLGVYDRFDTLQLELGAYNHRRGADALGAERDEPIDELAGGEVLRAPEHSRVAEHIEALAGREFHGYEVVVAQARPANSYLCNETHYRALRALGAHDEGRLREVYFLHIPYAEHDAYEGLADGVAALVLGLAGLEGPNE